MGGNIALGRYTPYNSIIHRIDPRTKIVGVIGLLVAIFLNLTFWEYVFVFAVCLLLVLLSKVKITSILKSLKAVWFMMLLLTVINIFVIHTGEPLFSIGNFTLYVGSLIQTAKIVVRLIMVITLTTVLTSTTKPLDLTYALEWYMAPLKLIKFPAHEIAMTISIALRFIPTLLEETQRLIKAQASRGVDLENGSIKDKMVGITSLIVPLFVSSFQKSEELADAMEARGYNPGAKRTRYRTLHFGGRDIGALIFVGLVLALAILSINHPEYARSIWPY